MQRASKEIILHTYKKWKQLIKLMGTMQNRFEYDDPYNVLRICARFNGAYTLLCVWCGLDVLTLNLARTLFLFFFSVGIQQVRN